MITVNDRQLLENIRRNMEAGGRLTPADALALYRTPDLPGVGALANAVKERRHGDKVFYNINRHINYSNLCALSCMFCAFAKKRGDADGYEYTIEEMIAKAGEAVAQGATEIHMVGGLHPDHPYEFYPRMLRAVKQAYPQLHIKAFTAVEIDYFARLSGKTLERVFADLVEAGLGSMPGGGAEILNDRVWHKLYKDKMGPADWLRVQRAAHTFGLRSNATMLFGHIETDEECVEHLFKLRDLQDETGGFMAFIPLRFHPWNTPLEKLGLAGANACLRHIAVARLALDNFDHIKTYWTMNGLDAAQMSLYFGADDFDGTVMEEKITAMAGGSSPQFLTVDRLKKLVRDAGRVPVQRDTLYRELAATA